MWIYVKTVIVLAACICEPVTFKTMSASGPTTIPCEKYPHKHYVAGGGKIKMVTLIHDNVIRLKTAVDQCLGNGDKLSNGGQVVLNDHEVFDEISRGSMIFMEVMIQLWTNGIFDLETEDLWLSIQESFAVKVKPLIEVEQKFTPTANAILNEGRLIQYMESRKKIGIIRAANTNFILATTKSGRDYAHTRLVNYCRTHDLSDSFVHLGNQFRNDFDKVLLQEARYDRTTMKLYGQEIKSHMCEAQLLLSACSVAFNQTREAFEDNQQKNVKETLKIVANSFIATDSYTVQNASSL